MNNTHPTTNNSFQVPRARVFTSAIVECKTLVMGYLSIFIRVHSYILEINCVRNMLITCRLAA